MPPEKNPAEAKDGVDSSSVNYTDNVSYPWSQSFYYCWPAANQQMVCQNTFQTDPPPANEQQNEEEPGPTDTENRSE